MGSQVLFPEYRQLKSIFIQEQTEIVQTILFLDFLARLPLKHVLCIEYVRSLHGLWFVHQKETDFFLLLRLPTTTINLLLRPGF